MEAIIFIVLLTVASSMFQSWNRKDKEQKRPATVTQGVKPIVQPKVKANGKTSHTDLCENFKKSEAPIQKPRIQVPNIIVEPEKFEEEMETDYCEDAMMLEQNEGTCTTSFDLENDIGFDELQRSIIMAEVLGKPKALKKVVR